MKKDLETILAYTNKVNECLEWTRCLNSEGYARAVIDKYANAKVHRIVYELVNGPLLPNEVVRHTCDNRKCINPEHLLKGSQQDNIRDKNERSGNGQAKVTKDQVKAIRKLSSDFTRKELAAMFGIDARTVSSIVLNKHWKHVK